MTSQRPGIPITQDDLNNRFGFHPATPETGPMHEAVRGNCLALASTLNSLVPDGREKSLMITALEEAMMWANAGIARGLAPLE